MTDNEIITALELLAILVCETDAQKETVCSALDLINRQQAEIERLHMMIDSDNEVCTECHCEYMDKVHQARIEAI